MRIVFPTSLNLNENQKQLAREFASKFSVSVDDDEDACMSSFFTFHIYSSGIGDVIHLSYGPNSIFLGSGLED